MTLMVLSRATLLQAAASWQVCVDQRLGAQIAAQPGIVTADFREVIPHDADI